MTKVAKEDLKIIKKQLGRYPQNIHQIVLRCQMYDNPQVLETLPFDGKKRVFPTLYWLSCPFLNKKVSQLEDEGMVKHFTNKIKKNEHWAQQLADVHNSYAQKRVLMLTKKDKEKIRAISTDMLKMIKQSGVGGIRDKKGIKCLHAHLADYLVQEVNPVGKKVYRLLQNEECAHDCSKNLN